MLPLKVASIILAVSFTLVVGALGGFTALAYLVVFVFATLPGLPLGFLLFGPRHAAGWVTGTLLGYAITALACWAVIFAGVASSPAFVAAWAVTTGFVWAIAWWPRQRDSSPLVSLRDWTNRDTLALVLVLNLVPILTGPAFSRVSARDTEGNDLYRAYFTADFVWHMALVAELQKHDHPPRNPFLASERIHYYWTYFQVPAAAGPLTGADVELSLKVNAVATAMLFVAAVYVAAWAAVPTYPLTLAAAVALTIIAASAEGLAAIMYLASNGEPLTGLRDLNVDALSRGFGGLRIDNLPRAMWYTPQHSMAYSLGLVALPVAIAAGVGATTLAIFLAGVALGASVTLNPLVGAIFCAVYGVVVGADAIRTRAGISAVLRHALSIVPVATALAWTSLNEVADGAAGALEFGLSGPAASAPVPSFLLSFGPILIPLVAGLWPQRLIPFRTVAGAAAGVLLSVLVMHLVVLAVDLFWIGFRTGHLFFVFAPALVARGLVALSGIGRRVAFGVGGLVLALGAPTTAIDAFNAQDVENVRMGPGGFHWTVRITPAQQEALTWIREQTPPDAIVQADPTARGRETWSLIPTWGERRMAAGLPISLMHEAAYDAGSAMVRQIYAGPDPAEAWRAARKLGIDFLYVDSTERRAYPNVAKFDRDPLRFAAVFRNDEAVVYAVK
jgi:hypothetical protein